MDHNKIFKSNEEYLQVIHEVYGDKVTIKFPLFNESKLIKSKREIENFQQEVKIHLEFFQRCGVVTQENMTAVEDLTVFILGCIPEFVKGNLTHPLSKINEIFSSIHIAISILDDTLDEGEGGGKSESADEKLKQLYKDKEKACMFLDFMEDLFLGEYKDVTDLPEEVLKYCGKYAKTIQAIQIRMDELKELSRSESQEKGVVVEYRRVFESYLREFLRGFQASYELALDRALPTPILPPALKSRLHNDSAGGAIYFEYTSMMSTFEYGLPVEIRNHEYYRVYNELSGHIVRVINELLGLGLDVDAEAIIQNTILQAYQPANQSNPPLTLQEIVDRKLGLWINLCEELYIVGERMLERFERSLEVEQVVKGGRAQVIGVLCGYYYTKRYRRRCNEHGETTRFDYVIGGKVVDLVEIS